MLKSGTLDLIEAACWGMVNDGAAQKENELQNGVKTRPILLQSCETSDKRLLSVLFVARCSFAVLAVIRMFSRILCQARASSLLPSLKTTKHDMTILTL
jgi:hypothetical protein